MTKSKDLYSFIDSSASFNVEDPQRVSGLYLPLCNEEGLLSAVTPSLHGDIKLDQHTFLNIPVSVEDLHLNLASRNFWISTKTHHWSVTGQSAWQKALPTGKEVVSMEAGILWQKIRRRNAAVGLEATVLSFVPSLGGTFEVMQVEVKNISKKSLPITATTAIPLFGRSADNLRDHRHVTSLLHRLSLIDHGIKLCPTMSFNEKGHALNTTVYYVMGADGTGQPPIGVFPTVLSFIGEGGALDRPAAIFQTLKPRTAITEFDQGQEAMGALQFEPQVLKPGASLSFALFIGIDPTGSQALDWVKKFGHPQKIHTLFETMKKHWSQEISRIEFQTGDSTFNQWLKWVQIQPTLRKIFGCSFLPDFDYGRGGRGWRDLWQDCLALLLAKPDSVRNLIIGNFAGVRIDGSNATIIGKTQPGLTGGDESLYPSNR
jgi:cellobiose phosphorylase